MSKSLENITLRSEEVQEILTQVPKWMVRWGSTLFFFVITLILAISWFIKYPDVISSETIITTEIPPQKEFANITAKIDTIYVKDSEIIAQNRILAVLENTANTEDVLYLKSILDTITFKNKSFVFPIEELPILFLGDIDQSFANFENNYSQYALNKKLQPFSNEVLANTISLSELKGRLGSLRAQHALNESEISLKNNDLERSKNLFDKGVISEQEYENKQQEVLLAERSFQNLGVSISQVREAISNAKNTSKGTEITRTKAELQLLKGSIQSFNQLKKAVKDWENDYVLKSEINGKVSFLNYWSKNQTVSQGDIMFVIIPTENSSYVAKVKAPPQNSGKIKIGQKVNVKLQNYPEDEFGILNISLVPDKDGFYLIDVSLPELLVTSYNKEIEFKQEMRGVAEIITEDLRLIERFFYQFKELVER
jgi:multidrug resistance efflux pump